MKADRNRLATLAAVALALALWGAGCNPNPPNPPPDGGGGSGGAGGTGGGGGGQGSDAGPGADQCGPVAGPCDAGSCMLMQLEDGGRGRRCVAGACDLVAQDCDAGFKCDYRDGGRTCVAEGTLAEGAACLGAGDDCKKGLVCATVPQTDAGYEFRCAKFCGSTGDCTGPQACLLTLVIAESSERPQICADPPPSCDLLTQSCAQSRDGCYPSGATGACYAAGQTPPGGVCVLATECARGATCVNTTGGATCRAYCAYPPPGTPGCDAGTCTRLAGTTGVGVCI